MPSSKYWLAVEAAQPAKESDQPTDHDGYLLIDHSHETYFLRLPQEMACGVFAALSVVVNRDGHQVYRPILDEIKAQLANQGIDWTMFRELALEGVK